MTIYYHNHHIIPKHMGGTDDPENLVKVTVEQHAALHKQLWEDLGHWQDKLAWQFLSGQIEDKSEIQKEAARNFNLERLKKGNHPFTGGEIQRKTCLRMLKEGTHPSQIKSCVEKIKKAKEKYNYEILDMTDNTIYTTKNLLDFCKEKNINQGALMKTFSLYKGKGKVYQHKNYRILKKVLIGECSDKYI